jgi:hypothetical protein
MAATSRHYGDIAVWINKVIDSCDHPLQEITARKLVRNFEKHLERSSMDVWERQSLIRPMLFRIEEKRWDRTENRLKKKK